jgi:hypothetical protein
MTARMSLLGAVLLSILLGPLRAWSEDAQADSKTSRNDLNDLSLEVTALQILHQFQFSLAQMEKIRQYAKESAETGRKRQEAQASEEYRDRLHELHKALLRGTDVESIDQLSDELDDLRYEEKPLLEDDVKITKEARKHAPEVLRLLKANQYAAYAALLVDLADPLDLLTESLLKVRELKRADWREQRQKIAAEVGRLVGGVDAAKEEDLKKAVAALLTRARRFKSEDFEDQRAELEKAARQIVGSISPADVIRNEIEFAIAELLSNERLAAALAARLQL